MRTVVAAVAIALMTAILALHATPLVAQQIPSISEKPKDKKGDGDASARAAAKKADERYKAATDNLPDQKLDPWRNLR